jgi:RNA polymerase sigma factor (sigma-70 family)
MIMDVAEVGFLTNCSSSDEELLWAISLKGDDIQEAHNAFAIFYDRYKSILWSLCVKVCSSFRYYNNDELAKEVFSMTMMKIYLSPTYVSSKSKITTWMSTIAKRELISIIRGQRKDGAYFEYSNTDIADVFQNVEEGLMLPEKDILRQALSSLTEREQHILMTYMLYLDGRKHLPDNVLNELMTQYETTTDNIKHIKSRALAKVKEYIKQNSDLLS